jgi:DNA modification methylase
MTTDDASPPRFLSPAPETDVAEFLAAHGTPYDPDTDTYQRDPLVVHGKHGKASAIYNAHAYHTKVPPDAIKPYIEHYTKPGDIVLDPFCGSGMTGVAALLAGRDAIVSDLSPAAVHIAYNYCTPVDLTALKREWERIKADVRDEFRWLYGTKCDSCGGGATIQYTVWSDVLACPRCEGDIVLWDVMVVRDKAAAGFDPPLSGLTSGFEPPLTSTVSAKVARNGTTSARAAGDMVDEFECPSCRATAKKANCAYVRTVPALTSYECDGQCRPKRRERALTEPERDRIAEIAAKEPPYWIPDTPFDPTREMYLRNSKIFRDQGITRVRDFWTPRNLWALASLWSRASAVEDERLARALRFVLTSTFQRSGKTTRFLFGKGGNSSLAGTLYIGGFTCENNLLLLAGRKWDDIWKGLLEQTLFKGGAGARVGECSATELDVPTGVVDYVFTDPPFGSNIFYADCSLLWETWLGELTEESQEAVWNKSKGEHVGGKSLEGYGGLMEQSFAEMYRVLKPGRWATVVFSNSDDRVWHAIQVAAQKAGFAVAGAGTLDKMQRSFKGVKGDKGEEKVVTKDVVMNLLKPVEGAAIHVSELVEDPEALVRERLSAYLATLATHGAPANGERTTQSLYDHIVTSLLAEGIPTAGFGLAFIQSVAQESFKQVDGLWYRRGDRVQTNRLGMDIVDETSAVAWLDARLSVQPSTEAEIIPEFNRLSAGARIPRSLGDLLRENFRLDKRTNTWRLPTAQEREALNDAGADQRRRLIRRIADGGSEDRTALELLELAEEGIRLGLHTDAGRVLSRVHGPELSTAERERATLARYAIDASVED